MSVVRFETDKISNLYLDYLLVHHEGCLSIRTPTARGLAMAARDVATYKRPMASLSLTKLEIVVAHFAYSGGGQNRCSLTRLDNHFRPCFQVEGLG